MKKKIEIKKMAEKKVSVVVVEGEFLELYKLGIPLPAAVSLQEAGLHLRDASWNLRKSSGGLSLSLFWPSPSSEPQVTKSTVPAITGVVQGVVKRKKKRSRKARRRRQSVCAPGPDSGDSVRVCSSKDSAAIKVCSDSSTEQPSEVAQQSEDSGHNTVEIDPFLVADPVRQAKITELELIPPPSEWKDVFYQADDDFTPGICIEAKSGELSWSPVKITKSVVCSPDESPGDSCMVLTHNDLVETEIEIHDGNPYFIAETLNDSFCVPIAHRTRFSKHRQTSGDFT